MFSRRVNISKACMCESTHSMSLTVCCPDIRGQQIGACSIITFSSWLCSWLLIKGWIVWDAVTGVIEGGTKKKKILGDMFCYLLFQRRFCTNVMTYCNVINKLALRLGALWNDTYCVGFTEAVKVLSICWGTSFSHSFSSVFPKVPRNSNITRNQELNKSINLNKLHSATSK